MSNRFIQWYGWSPEKPDFRDFKFAAVRKIGISLPENVDLTPYMPPVYDQGAIGSCVSNSSAAMAEFLMKKSGHHEYNPSRLFIYYYARDLEGDPNQDSGCENRDGMKVMATMGVGPESLWWYDINKYMIKPNHLVREYASKHVVGNYHRLDNRNLDELKACLAEGFPFIFGFTVYEEFEGDVVAKTGILNMPKATDKVVGGHSVLCVGYRESDRKFIVRNSWGSDWGRGGYFEMPYEYLTSTDLSDDFWTARSIS